MDSTRIEITQNDTAPIEIDLSDANGAVALPIGTTAVFRMKQRQGSKLTEVDCDLTPDSPTVSVPFASGDTDRTGLYDVEVEVTFPNTQRRTFKSGKVVSVLPELG